VINEFKQKKSKGRYEAATQRTIGAEDRANSGASIADDVAQAFVSAAANLVLACV
jgi:hypothetical protein